MATSLRLLKTDYVDLWQIHAVQNQDDIDKILSPGGAIEAFEAAKQAGKCRFIGFTGHYDPEALAALLKAYVQKRAVVGAGVYTGPTMEYWKKKASNPEPALR